MKKKDFDNRLQNDLFPEMPISFGRKLTKAMEDEGVKVKKRPTVTSVFAGAISLVAAAAVLLIVLLGVLSGGKSNPIQAAAPGETRATAAPWKTKVFTLSSGFEFANEEKFQALCQSILSFLMEQGKNEPDEMWLCAIKNRYVAADTGNRADGYLSGYYVLAQHAFGADDAPEIYCLSEDFEVLWCTEGSVPGPNHVVVPREEDDGAAYQSHFIYGMSPTDAHVTRGVLVGAEPGTDIEFSMATSITDVKERLTGSAHRDTAREYFLIAVSAYDWDSVIENPILRFDTAEGNVDVNMKTDLPKSTVVLGDRFTFSPIPTFEPNIPPEPTTTPDIPDPVPTLDPDRTPVPKIVDLTGQTCLTGEPDYGTLILRALENSGVRTPRELWLCAVDPFSENEDTVHRRALILAQYVFEGAAGPELFYYEDGRILWMTEGYEPEGINVAVDQAWGLTILFGVSPAYDGRPLAMTGGIVAIENDDPRTFGPVLSLEKVQQIVGEGPNYDYAREFYLCSLPNGGEVTGVMVEAAGKTFTRTGQAVVWPAKPVPAMAVESDGVVYPGMVTVLAQSLDENGVSAEGEPLAETLANGILLKGKYVWRRPLTILTASDAVTVDRVTVLGVASGDNAEGETDQLQLDGADLELDQIDALPAGEYYLCFRTTTLGPYSEKIGRYTYQTDYTIYKVTLE